MSKPHRITEMQLRLCQGVARHGNIARAQRDAGYSDYSTAHRMLKLPHVAAHLAQLIDSATDESAINLNRIAGELAAIGLANIADYYDVNGVIKLQDLSRDAAAAIQELTVSESGAVKIKLHSKLTALENLTKMLGGYEAHNAQKQVGASTMPVRDLARRVAFMLRQADNLPPEPVTIEHDTGKAAPF